MALNRLTGLGVLLGTSMLMAVACDSGGDSNNNNNNGGVGGNSGETGGTSSTSSSSKATGGSATTKTTAKATGGKQSTDTSGDATGGTDSTDTGDCTADAPTASTENCTTASDATGSFTISNKNYFSVGPYAGYGYVFIAPTSDSTTSVTCANTTFGPTKTALCGAGTVPQDCSYNAVAGVGFNLSQLKKGGDGSELSIADTVSTMTIEFVNTAGSGLHVQVVQNSDSGPINYCYEASSAESPLNLNASDFTTKCWQADDPGDAWDGTNARALQMIIPSTAAAAVPFDICVTNLTING